MKEEAMLLLSSTVLRTLLFEDFFFFCCLSRYGLRTHLISDLLIPGEETQTRHLFDAVTKGKKVASGIQQNNRKSAEETYQIPYYVVKMFPRHVLNQLSTSLVRS